jgi:hypothetical protein
MDAGWITYLFDTYGVTFTTLTNAEIKAGRLRDRFDVIIFPDQGAEQIMDGHAVGTVPPDYIGGIGDEGIVALREFLEDGGRLICNNRSCDLPMNHFRLPLENRLEGVSPDSFNCPGAILKAEFETSHAVAYGMPERGMVFFSGGRVFDLQKRDPEVADESVDDPDASVAVIARYPHEPLLLSGWMLGDELIRGGAAAVEIGVGAGSIVAFGFNVHNRGQARSTLRLLFNALWTE